MAQRIPADLLVGGGAARRYNRMAMTLHWILALLIVGQLLGAWYMSSLPDDSPAQDNFEKIHISVGLTILLFSILRLGVRLVYPPPPLPAGLAAWERGLAHASHVAFYVLMFAIPLTGWSLKSFFPRPLGFWGIQAWPRLPWFGGLPREVGFPLYNQIETVHGGILAWTLVALLLLHVAGALKHQFDGAPVLWRMWPFMRK